MPPNSVARRPVGHPDIDDHTDHTRAGTWPRFGGPFFDTMVALAPLAIPRPAL